MLSETTKTLLDEAWRTLTEPVRSALVRGEHRHAIQHSLSGRHLSPEDSRALEEEVLMTLLGLQSRKDFIDSLPTQLKGLSSNESADLAKRIDVCCFEPLAPHLIEISEVEDEEPAVIPTTPNAPLEQSEKVPVAQTGTASPLEQFIRKDAAVSERYAKLPEEVRTAIISPEVANAFSSTIRSYDVSQEGFMALGAETARLLVGLVSTNDFRTRVRERSIVPPERYENFVRELEGTVVKPVQQAIMAVLANRKSASA